MTNAHGKRDMRVPTPFESEVAHQRLTFLAETGAILSCSPDYLMMLDNLARSIVPFLADWCVIDMLADDGWVHRLALAHRDPQKRGVLEELKSRYPRLPLEAEHTLLGVLRTRRSWLRPELPEAQGRVEARDEHHWRILQALGYTSEMVVPLVARGRILGTITFVLGQTARRYGPDDLALAEDLARRCAVAVDNARLYQQAREAEARLRAQLDTTNTVMRSLGEGLYTLDRGGRLTFLNSAAEHLLGWSPMELLGQPMHGVIHGRGPDGQPVPTAACRILEVLRSGATVQGEEVFTRRDGTTFPVAFTSSPIVTAGEVVGAVVAFQDITARKRVEAEAEQRRRETEVLAHLAQTINASLDLDVVLQRVVEAAQELSGSERAVIFLREPGADAIISRYQVGYPEMPYEGLRIELGKGIGGQVLLTGRPLRTADYAADPRFSKDYLGSMRSGGRLAVITVPITIGSRVEGVLYVSNSASHPFSEGHEAILMRLADHAATAVRNARLYREAADELARRIQAEEALKASLREKEVLLKEIHHRVKNNLQIISSLLELQSGYSDDPRLQAMFEDSQHRIQSMALIHEHLYQASDLARIDFGSYVRSLATQLLRSYHHLCPRVTLSTDMAAVSLGIDRAVSCGLLVNELVTNSLKHAFPHEQGGDIHLALQADAHRVTLTVRDTGVGFPEDLDFRATDSLGLQLVCALTEQLGGTIALERHRGTVFRLTFPASGVG
jgi:PAS domain S-box-containing protein